MLSINIAVATGTVKIYPVGSARQRTGQRTGHRPSFRSLTCLYIDVGTGLNKATLFSLTLPRKHKSSNYVSNATGMSNSVRVTRYMGIHTR